MNKGLKLFKINHAGCLSVPVRIYGADIVDAIERYCKKRDFDYKIKTEYKMGTIEFEAWYSGFPDEFPALFAANP